MPISSRAVGSLIAFETGETTTYGIFNSQDSGPMFVDPSESVYAGQIVGMGMKGDDIVVNVCKKKHMSAVRSTGHDDAYVSSLLLNSVLNRLLNLLRMMSSLKLLRKAYAFVKKNLTILNV